MAQRTALRELKLKEKMDLLNFLESSNQRKTAEKFGVSKTTVSNILKCKEEYLEEYILPKMGNFKEKGEKCVLML